MTENPVQALGKLLAHRGVAPSLLATNIQDPEYRSVRIWKEGGCVRVETMCDDPDTGDPMTFLYQYDQETVLVKIDATIGGRTTVYFDREAEIRRLSAAIASQRRPQASIRRAVDLRTAGEA